MNEDESPVIENRIWALTKDIEWYWLLLWLDGAWEQFNILKLRYDYTTAIKIYTYFVMLHL
jgi:hypothetical protein